MTTGVIVGKFYPPHRGHKYLIDTAASQVDQLTVICCGKPEHTISGRQRGQWLREIHPDARVLVIDDRLDAADSALWAANTISWLGYVPDVVFTSEEYGHNFARCLGSRHVQVDRTRTKVPCSGTAIRQNPLSNWEYLEAPLRAHFAMRICVVGAESTGTTTLARALAHHYQTQWVPEYGREYCEIKYSGPQPNEWATKEFVHIAEEQSRRENLRARNANRVLLCDTNAWATDVWHHRYLGFGSPKVQAVAARQRYALYLLTDVDIPFVQDGLRDGEHIRHAMHEEFVRRLQDQETPFAVISGSAGARTAAAITLIDDLTGSSSIRDAQDS